MEASSPAEPGLEPIPHEECLVLLRAHDVGRIAVVRDEFPLVVPVNYRVVQTGDRVWIALRTRPGNMVETAVKVGFEIDHADHIHQEGWSVVARGMLMHVDPDAADFRSQHDPEPWLLAERDAWLVIEPFEITGRRLVAPHPGWHFDQRGYL
jgi:hypothetical protein